MSKIYKIESLVCPDVYYGTTTKKYLSERMTFYRYEYKKYLKAKSDDNNFKKYCNMKQEYGHQSLLNLFELFDKFDVKNFKINIINTIDSKNIDNTKSYLFDYIKNNNCINNNSNINKIV
jgi:hypothetical protein